METLDQVIFVAGLVLFVIALLLFVFMLIEYLREKEKLLKVRARVDGNANADVETAEDDGEYGQNQQIRSSSRNGSDFDIDEDAISNRLGQSPAHSGGPYRATTTAISRPESGIFAITLCGRGRMISTEAPRPPPPFASTPSRPTPRWSVSQSPQVKELCSFTQPLDDLPPSYAESFRYPPVPPAMVHLQQAQHVHTGPQLN